MEDYFITHCHIPVNLRDAILAGVCPYFRTGENHQNHKQLYKKFLLFTLICPKILLIMFLSQIEAFLQLGLVQPYTCSGWLLSLSRFVRIVLTLFKIDRVIPE